MIWRFLYVNSVDPDQLANWSGSALFVTKYLNLYEHLGSINLIDWKTEVGVASRQVAVPDHRITRIASYIKAKRTSTTKHNRNKEPVKLNSLVKKKTNMKIHREIWKLLGF